MQMLILALALFLMLNLGAGMWRVLRGPTAADRMLVAQLFGTTTGLAGCLPAVRNAGLISRRHWTGVYDPS
jgi:multicomponent Na+:H+ antiporter subunit F